MATEHVRRERNHHPASTLISWHLILRFCVHVDIVKECDAKGSHCSYFFSVGLNCDFKNEQTTTKMTNLFLGLHRTVRNYILIEISVLIIKTFFK